MELSIIIPIYNNQEYVHNLLDSIYGQDDYGVKYEVIVVDDMSTDNTFETLQSYKLKNKSPALRLFRNKKNSGTAATRNVGIKKSLGKWIQFVDSDDKMPDDYFKHIKDCMLREDVDCFVYGVNMKYNSHLDSYRPRGQVDQRMIGYKNIVVNKIYKKDIVKKFDPGFTFEDMIWIVDMINQRTLNIELIENVYYEVNRTNENSKMANFKQEDWYKMASCIVYNSTSYNDKTREFILEVFVGTVFSSMFSLKSRIKILVMNLLANYKFIASVYKDGIRKKDEKKTYKLK